MPERVDNLLIKLDKEILNNLSEMKVILMAGLPGSGKSTVARELVRRFGAHILRSDDIRQEMFGDSNAFEKKHSDYLVKSEKVYEVMRERMIEISQNGGKVIVDATHLSNHRSLTIQKLKENGLVDSSIIVLTESDDDMVFERQRKRLGDPGSGETWEEGCRRIRSWFREQIDLGNVNLPNEREGITVLTVKNL